MNAKKFKLRHYNKKMIKINTKDFTVVKEYGKNGMTSRGEEEEKLRVIMNLLHIETHLNDAMVADKKQEKEIAKLQDKVRKTRQDMVRVWAGPTINPNFWCSVKHALETQRHIEECVESAARHRDMEKLKKLNEGLRELINVRDELIDKFKSGRESDVDVCWRCEGDVCYVEENEETPVLEMLENGDMDVDEDGSLNEIGIAVQEKLNPVLEELEKLGTYTTKYTDWVIQ